MHTILIVDDSAVERRLAGGLLQAAGDYRLSYAENGNEALDCIAQALPDVVVTDLIMPGMDGLELVRTLRKMYPRIPVILMTAYGNEMIAAKALREGAVSYVPKSMRATTLVHTVQQVLERADAVKEQHQLAKNLERIDCTYVLEGDPTLIKPLVDLVENALASVMTIDEAEHIRVGVALEEALCNALYHGTLSLDESVYAAVKASDRRDRFDELIAKCTFDPERRITFKMNISRNEAQFVIRDEGEGCRALLLQPVDAASDDFETGRNRGLKLIWNLMDDVRYNDAGNEVKLSLYAHDDEDVSEEDIVENV